MAQMAHRLDSLFISMLVITAFMLNSCSFSKGEDTRPIVCGTPIFSQESADLTELMRIAAEADLLAQTITPDARLLSISLLDVRVENRGIAGFEEMFFLYTGGSSRYAAPIGVRIVYGNPGQAEVHHDVPPENLPSVDLDFLGIGVGPRYARDVILNELPTLQFGGLSLQPGKCAYEWRFFGFDADSMDDIEGLVLPDGSVTVTKRTKR